MAIQVTQEIYDMVVAYQASHATQAAAYQGQIDAAEIALASEQSKADDVLVLLAGIEVAP
jgi:hypothetical protein